MKIRELTLTIITPDNSVLIDAIRRVAEIAAQYPSNTTFEIRVSTEMEVKE